MKKVLEKINGIGCIVACIVVLFMCLSISYATIVRTAGGAPPIWIPQFNEYALVWMTFLATAWALSEGRHVSVDLLSCRLKPAARRVFAIVGDVLCSAVCAAMTCIGGLTVWENFRDRTTDVQAVDVPKAYVLVVIPLGFLLLFFGFIQRLLKHRRGDLGECELQETL